MTDLFAQENVGGFLTSKQLDGALRRKDLQLSDASDPEIALPIAKTLGATDLILGAVHRADGKLTLEAKRYSVVSREFTRQETVSGGPNDLPTLSTQLAQKLLDVNPKTKPMSSSVKALEQAANCWFDLVRYPLQPRVGNTPALETAAALEASCKAALVADGQLTWAHAGSAILKALKGDITAARAEVKSARSKGRFEAWLWIADYFAARCAHDANGSRAALEGALKERPGFFMAAGYLADERMEAADYKGAAAAWDRVLKIAPRHPFALGQKGKAFGYLHKDRDALALTRQALDVDPGDPELMVELASRQIDAQQNQEAEATLRQVMQAKPPRPRAWLRLGYLYMRENRMQDAHDTLIEALTYAYRDDESRTRGIAFCDLAQVAGAQGNYNEAIQYLQQARSEGTATLPCDAPELRAFRGKPEFNAICPAK
jgi:tetratricopeptide (TPR) repeat protein